MTSVSVIIPWYKREPDPWRDNALAYVQRWWSVTFPDWPVIIGAMNQEEGPWRKGLAVHRALQKTDADTIVVADADVICTGVREAVDQIAALRCGWAVPHRLVCRLTSDATTLLIQDGRKPADPKRGTRPDYAEVHQGIIGGGLVVLPRKLLSDIPIDPRFTGWGQEDYSWARALTMLAGHPWRGPAPLLHLWHDPQTTSDPRRGVGSAEGYALWQRYQDAATLPTLLDVVEEAKKALEDLSERAIPTTTDE